MGWKENGKYGISTGRTIRSPFASKYSYYSYTHREILIKFTRGTEGLSSDEMEEFLTQNDIGDGLGDFNESATRLVRSQGVDRSCKVPYSLNKRKRWQLSENVNLLKPDDDSVETAPSVVLIHRRVPSFPKQKADCIAVEKFKEREVFRRGKSKYTRVHDLLEKCDKAELEPEVCYEISYRYPMNEWPLCAEVAWSCRCAVCRWDFPNPRKAPCKNKGVKNKGRRWHLYSDAEVRGKVANEELFCRKHVRCRRPSRHMTDSKVQVMEASQFRECNAQATESSRSCAKFTCTLGSYIDKCSKSPERFFKKRQHRRDVGCRIENQSLDHLGKYGKNSVIYIDPEPSVKLTEDQQSVDTTAFAPKAQVLQAEKKVVVTLPLDADDVKPANLKACWKNLYTEANSFPRKFTIEVTSLLSDEGNSSIDSCCLLFEPIKDMSNTMVCTTTDVSLHITGADDINTTIICMATTKIFYSEIESIRQEIWKVSDVVDHVVFCIQDCFQALQLPMKNSSNCKQKTWRSVEVLGSMFGWKSEALTQMEMKSELRKKIKKVEKIHFENDFDICDGTMDLLEMSCGICCEKLGECFIKVS